MAKCEDELLDYSRSLTKRNKFYIDKGPNFEDPPTRDEDDQKWPKPSGNSKGTPASSSADGGIAPR
eukprot:3668750-Karenia_brevis.AAC.1